MNIEFTVEQIRAFVAKGYPSVAARMTKSLLQHYDAVLASNPKEPEAVHGNEAKKEVCEHGNWIYGENRRRMCGKANCTYIEEY